jgi:flavin reductase (DIM6/NTAB) family NADH-FMN oxidoreductase RutF
MSAAETVRRATSVDTDTFRQVLATVCTPVAVVTTSAGNRHHGTTVGAFCSLSLDPPLILIALDRGSDLLELITRSGRYGVNVLAENQHEIAAQFAMKSTDKFAGVDWRTDRGLPRLTDAAAWLICGLRELVPGGDHLIAVGAVEQAESADRQPLLYHRRTFGTLRHA